jgi:hypothetical protein
MGETGAPSMEDVAGVLSNVCPPTEGAQASATRDPAHRFKG